jgi:hypothetical protein
VITATDNGSWSNWDKDSAEDDPILDDCNSSYTQLQRPVLTAQPVCYTRMDNASNILVRNFKVQEFSIPATTATTSTTADMNVIQKDAFGINHIYPTQTADQGEWSSTSWSNGENRILKYDPNLGSQNCINDPYDNKLAVIMVGNPNITIDGNGIMKVACMPDIAGGPRLAILGTWTNVEQTIYVRIPASAKLYTELQHRPKTDHYCVSSGDFGGYIHYVNLTENPIATYFKKERSHTIGYSARVGQVSLDSFPENAWIGIKSICYKLPNDYVKLETWIDMNGGVDGGNWVKRAEKIDDGTWSGAGGGLPIQTGSSGGSGLRINFGIPNIYVEYKWMTVREIQIPT